MDKRIESEIALLRNRHPDLEFVEAGLWVLLPHYRPGDGWAPDEIRLTFQIPAAYPGTAPYGFYVPSSLRYNGSPPANRPRVADPPFEGEWTMLSWSVENGEWKPAADPSGGSNLVQWVIGFRQRFVEGA